MASASFSVDANVLLDWLLLRDKKRGDATDLLLNSSSNIGVAEITILEMAYVLEKIYEQPRDLIVDNLSRIVEDDRFICNKVLFRQVLPLYESKPALSFADCCAVFNAKLSNALPLYTFDKKLANQSGGLAKLIISSTERPH